MCCWHCTHMVTKYTSAISKQKPHKTRKTKRKRRADLTTLQPENVFRGRVRRDRCTGLRSADTFPEPWRAPLQTRREISEGHWELRCSRRSDEPTAEPQMQLHGTKHTVQTPQTSRFSDATQSHSITDTKASFTASWAFKKTRLWWL